MKKVLLLLMMCCLSFASVKAQESPPNTNNNFIPGSTSAIVYDIVYNNDMNTIDPWIGMLCESHVPNGGMGETMTYLFKKQFSDIKKQSERAPSQSKEKSPRKSPRKSAEQSKNKSPSRSLSKDEKSKRGNLREEDNKHVRTANRLETQESLNENSGKVSFGNDFDEYTQSVEESKESRKSSKLKRKLSKVEKSNGIPRHITRLAQCQLHC